MASTPTTFALVTAYPVEGLRRIWGVWVQDCCQGLDEAITRCKATSEVNGGAPMAVVPGFVAPGAQGMGEWCRDVAPLFICGRAELHAENAATLADARARGAL